MANKTQQRFDELLLLAEKISTSSKQSHSDYSGRQANVDSNLLMQWVTKAEDLIVNVCGSDSTYYKNFIESKNIKSYNGNEYVYEVLKSIFIATKDDYEKGYLTSYKSLIQAEVFDSELDQAKNLLQSGYLIAAAVIAGTILETSVREICQRNSVPLGRLNKMNDDLAKAGVYNAIQQKSILAMAAIRNSAAHGKPDEFSENDVVNMINSIEEFLLKYLN